MSDIPMPALGESVTEGTVTRWLKQVGDLVALDEPLLEISTDKVDTEIPSPVAGTLLEILVGEDVTVSVGTVLARIGSPDETGAQAGAQAVAQPVPPEPQAEVVSAPEAQPLEAQSLEAPDAITAELPISTEPEATFMSEEPTKVPTTAGHEPAERVPANAYQTEEVPLPALGESVTEGTVTRWLKQVGDPVEFDEPLLEISTDNVDTEILSPLAGTLLEILVGEDETVPVGTPVARIAARAGKSSPPERPDTVEQAHPATSNVPEEPVQKETPVTAPAPADAPAPAPAPAPAVPEYSAPVPQAEPHQPPDQPEHPQPPSAGYLTPLVRKLATDQAVNLESVTGTGVGGRIRKEDVLEAAAHAARERTAQPAAGTTPQTDRQPGPPAAQVPSLRGTTEEASRLRQVIASRMVEALQTMAQLTTVVEVDVTKIALLRARAKEDFRSREGVNLSFLPFFVLAATEALKTHPKINGFLEGNQITYHDQENIGIAVDTDRGLVVPVIREAGDLSLVGIAHRIADLAARTRENRVTPDELSGATFTVTNTGWGGAIFDTPIVPVGTSAILGTGAIVKRPVVATDEEDSDYVAIRSMCYLALSYDHRLIDGADAARYLSTVKRRLEEGEFEAELGL